MQPAGQSALSAAQFTVQVVAFEFANGDVIQRHLQQVAAAVIQRAQGAAVGQGNLRAVAHRVVIIVQRALGALLTEHLTQQVIAEADFAFRCRLVIPPHIAAIEGGVQ